MNAAASTSNFASPNLKSDQLHTDSSKLQRRAIGRETDPEIEMGSLNTRVPMQLKQHGTK